MRRGAGELWLVWALFLGDAVVVFSTYARVPAHELYHVSGSGLAGGASRVVVLLGFPISAAAIALAWAARPGLLAAVATLLCATIVIPGVVDQANLDAKWSNAPAVAGVAVALWLTASAAGRRARHVYGDRLRLALAAVLVGGGLPWIFAELGVSISDAPGLGSVFLGDQLRHAPHQETEVAVHLGHHHGLDGVLLALAALLLNRLRLRPGLRFYVAFMLVYGLANAVQDFWGEQIVKRGWTDASIPSLLRPAATLWWAGMLLAAALLWWRYSRDRSSSA